MRYAILFNLERPFTPSRCCGEFLFGSVISSAIEADVAEDNRDAQSRENARNRKFAHDEAELAREYQAKEWDRQYGIQRDEWYKQLAAQSDASYNNFVRQAQYNSPQNQMFRLREAGLNPSALLGNQGSGLVSAATGNLSAVGSPSVPSGGMVSSPVATASGQGALPPMKNPIPIDSIGSFIRDLSTASRTNKLAQAELDQIIAQTGLFVRKEAGQKLANDYQEICNFVADKTKDAKILKEFSEIGQIWADVALKQKTGQMYDSMSIYYKAEEALAKAKVKLTDKEYEKLVLEVDHWLDAYEVRMQNIKAQTSAYSASASLDSANAQTVNKLRNYVVENAKHLSSQSDALAKMSENDLYVSNATLLERVNGQISELKRAGVITDEQEEQLKRMRNDNKIYWYRQFLETTKMAKDMVPGTASDAMLLRMLLP